MSEPSALEALLRSHEGSETMVPPSSFGWKLFESSYRTAIAWRRWAARLAVLLCTVGIVAAGVVASTALRWDLFVRAWAVVAWALWGEGGERAAALHSNSWTAWALLAGQAAVLRVAASLVWERLRQVHPTPVAPLWGLVQLRAVSVWAYVALEALAGVALTNAVTQLQGPDSRLWQPCSDRAVDPSLLDDSNWSLARVFVLRPLHGTIAAALAAASRAGPQAAVFVRPDGRPAASFWEASVAPHLPWDSPQQGGASPDSQWQLEGDAPADRLVDTPTLCANQETLLVLCASLVTGLLCAVVAALGPASWMRVSPRVQRRQLVHTIVAVDTLAVRALWLCLPACVITGALWVGGFGGFFASAVQQLWWRFDALDVLLRIDRFTDQSFSGRLGQLFLFSLPTVLTAWMVAWSHSVAGALYQAVMTAPLFAPKLLAGVPFSGVRSVELRPETVVLCGASDADKKAAAEVAVPAARRRVAQWQQQGPPLRRDGARKFLPLNPPQPWMAGGEHLFDPLAVGVVNGQIDAMSLRLVGIYCHPKQSVVQFLSHWQPWNSLGSVPERKADDPLPQVTGSKTPLGPWPSVQRIVQPSTAAEWVERWKARHATTTAALYGQDISVCGSQPLPDWLALSRDLSFCDLSDALQHSARERLALLGDATGTRQTAAVLALTAVVDAVGITATAASEAILAPAAAVFKTPLAKRGGSRFLRGVAAQIRPFDPVVSQASWLLREPTKHMLELAAKVKAKEIGRGNVPSKGKASDGAAFSSSVFERTSEWAESTQEWTQAGLIRIGDRTSEALDSFGHAMGGFLSSKARLGRGGHPAMRLAGPDGVCAGIHDVGSRVCENVLSSTGVPQAVAFLGQQVPGCLQAPFKCLWALTFGQRRALGCCCGVSLTDAHLCSWVSRLAKWVSSGLDTRGYDDLLREQPCGDEDESTPELLRLVQSDLSGDLSKAIRDTTSAVGHLRHSLAHSVHPYAGSLVQPPVEEEDDGVPACGEPVEWEGPSTEGDGLNMGVWATTSVSLTPSMTELTVGPQVTPPAPQHEEPKDSWGVLPNILRFERTSNEDVETVMWDRVSFIAACDSLVALVRADSLNEGGGHRLVVRAVGMVLSSLLEAHVGIRRYCLSPRFRNSSLPITEVQGRSLLRVRSTPLQCLQASYSAISTIADSVHTDLADMPLLPRHREALEHFLGERDSVVRAAGGGSRGLVRGCDLLWTAIGTQRVDEGMLELPAGVESIWREAELRVLNCVRHTAERSTVAQHAAEAKDEGGVLPMTMPQNAAGLMYGRGGSVREGWRSDLPSSATKEARSSSASRSKSFPVDDSLLDAAGLSELKQRSLRWEDEGSE
jgi:hypothetical protein